jgi:hypothetical protein
MKQLPASSNRRLRKALIAGSWKSGSKKLLEA